MALLVSLELLAFIWSIVLYFAAVIIKGRRQEAGLGYSIVGLLAFTLYCCDRAPFLGVEIRHPLSFLGLPLVRLDRQSSLWLAIVVAILYAVRILVYYELILPADESTDRSGASAASLASLRSSNHENESVFKQANDLVAPVLAYATAAASVGALIALVFGLAAFWGALFAVFFVAAYYGTFLYRRLWASLRATVKALQYALSALWDETRKGYLKLIMLIARGEVARRGPANDSSPVYSWATRGIDEINRRSALRREALGAALRDIFSNS